MSAAFTPGPWKIDGRSLIVAPDERSGEYRSIALVRHNAATNAPLIQQAPELYRYLELALGILDRANVAWGGEPGARAILAKARGEAA